MPKPLSGAQPEFNPKEHNEKSRRIARDLTSLQREIRDDFDQRISNLANILQKFKTLMVTDIRSLSSANDEGQLPTLTQRVSDIPSGPQDSPDLLAGYSETARFEAGLYQLNCQLYRFRLELDQELEYREEPLHEHFRDESELADVLKRLTEKNQQEKSAGS